MTAVYCSLGEFLRTRRLQLKPADVGLARGPGSRRGAGLSRTQVAWMAGIPTSQYADLEEDCGTRPSGQALAALARALRLDADQRDFMFELSGYVRAVSDGAASHVEPALLALLDRMNDAPGWIMTDLHEVLAQNALATALLGRPPAADGIRASGIFRWFTEPGPARVRYPPEDHADHSARLVTDLRAASRRSPDDPRIEALAEALNRDSAEFAQLWEREGTEARRANRVRIQHPAIGLVGLDRARLTTDSGREHLVWYMPAIGTAAAVQLPMLGITSPSSRKAQRT